ncbi:MAG: HPF/RaiA family ribosome-associated protein [Candidatus Kapaibacterium sp.]|jgi:ribosomal subunit interface protein|nr:HPF/RaiA family ribosome-associated protein [Candidatus Kapabacteria bacterium]
MKTQITFRHTNSSHPRLQEEALQVANGFTKYHDGIISTNVEFINEVNKTVEITVHLQGTTVVGKVDSDDFHKSLHDASEKVVRQIQKYKTKIISNRTKDLELV